MPTSAALKRVLTRSAEQWHDAACGFCRIFNRISDRIFSNFSRCRKNFHPKSCEIAHKSARPDDGRPLQHSCRSSQGRLSTGAMRHADYVANFDAVRTENFRWPPDVQRQAFGFGCYNGFPSCVQWYSTSACSRRARNQNASSCEA